MNRKTIIIGGVAGGATTAARLRRLDEHRDIIIIERGEHVSFANCGLPYYIGGVIANKEALLLLKPEEMARKFRLDVRTFSEVTQIDPTQKKITIENLQTKEMTVETYDDLVISTGAYPVKPPIPGIQEAKNLFTLRNIPDADQIKQAIERIKPKHAVVVGGGFIGIEMAENLHHLGIHVTLVEMMNQVMTPLDFEMAAIVHHHMRDKGIKLILNDGVKAFEHAGTQLILQSGMVLNADLIIFSIGVRPENKLAKDAKLIIGERGGIWVNESLQTSDPSIYAIGDAIEVQDFINHQQTVIPLAGPANKQARIVANHLVGKHETYRGTMGTAVAKVFDLTVGSTGNNEKNLMKLGLPYQAIHIHPNAHAGYYPNAKTISMKILYHPETLAIYGAQAVGYEGVDKRIDVLATAIYANLKVTDLKHLELSYAPPYSSAKDPVNMFGFVSENLQNEVDTFDAKEVDTIRSNHGFFLDVREEIEFDLSHIPGAVNIPLFALRSSLDQLPKDQTIYVYCKSGVRAYNACRILSQHGFICKNLDGGITTYQYLTDVANEEHVFLDALEDLTPTGLNMDVVKTTLQVNACGLQCPGPILEVYKAMQSLKEGDQLEIQATDPGFQKDIKAWVDKTHNTLISLTNQQGTIIARIQKGSKTKETKVIESPNGTTLVVFSQDLDKAIAAMIIANGAQSMGKQVSIFFTFWGLNILRKPKRVKVKKSFIEKMFGMMMPRGTEKLPISNMNMAGIGPKMIRGIMKQKNVESLQALMKSAMDLGVRFIACAMSMDVMGIKKEELIDGIETGGVATYLADASESNHNLFI